MANGHGGRRPGAGRKKHAEKYAAVRESVTDAIAGGLPDRVAALELLAEGGYEQIEEVWEPAGLIFVDDIAIGDDGKVIRTRTRAFPDLKPDQLVCIRRKRAFAAPDRAANIYLIDRILGKPAPETDADADSEDDSTTPTPDELLELWTEVRADRDPPQQSDTSSAT